MQYSWTLYREPELLGFRILRWVLELYYAALLVTCNFCGGKLEAPNKVISGLWLHVRMRDLNLQNAGGL